MSLRFPLPQFWMRRRFQSYVLGISLFGRPQRTSVRHMGLSKDAFMTRSPDVSSRNDWIQADTPASKARLNMTVVSCLQIFAIDDASCR